MKKESNSSEKLLLELQKNIGSNPQIIGPLIGQVRSMQNKIENIELLNWVDIHGGRLSIGHRPSSKLLGDIQLQYGSYIITLLSEKEGARIIEKQTKTVGLKWLWFPMNSALPPDEERLPEVKALFFDITVALENHESVYIHCSAGIHRTGMISYGLLRYIGFDSKEALDYLIKLRNETGEGVGKERLAWGDYFGSN